MLPVALVIALKGLAQIIGAVIAETVVYSIFGSEMSASVTFPSENNIVRTPILER